MSILNEVNAKVKILKQFQMNITIKFLFQNSKFFIYLDEFKKKSGQKWVSW